MAADPSQRTEMSGMLLIKGLFQVRDRQLEPPAQAAS